MRKDRKQPETSRRQARATPAAQPVAAPLFADGRIPPLSELSGDLTLDQIYGWPPCTPEDRFSGLTTRLCELGERPLADIDSEDVCFLLRHKMGVDVFLDQAMDWLEQDPLADMQYYPGDLLIAVLDLDAEHLATPGRLTRLTGIATRALEIYEDADELRAKVAAGLERLQGMGEAKADRSG